MVTITAQVLAKYTNLIIEYSLGPSGKWVRSLRPGFATVDSHRCCSNFCFQHQSLLCAKVLLAESRDARALHLLQYIIPFPQDPRTKYFGI